MKKFTYKDSGVDIAKGERAIADAKSMIKTTFNKNVLSSIGGFGGLFEVPRGYESPVLVSSTDGVGTKLSVAVMAGKHDTVGEDLVNHCINDIAVLGAKPLYFLDYYGTARLDEQVFNQVISGFVRGCKNSGVALVGGETAEMPGIYHGEDYDLCGTIIGIIEKRNIVGGDKIRKGDMLVGLESNGLHTNGYSLARKVLFGKYKIHDEIEVLKKSLAHELLRVHRCYLSEIQKAVKTYDIHGISHITGGGIIGNTSRIIPKGMHIEIDWDSWDKQAIFDLIQQTGSVPQKDMRQTFNLGIGLIIILSEQDAKAFTEDMQSEAVKSWIVGKIK